MNADDKRLSTITHDVDNVARVLEQITLVAQSDAPVLLLAPRCSGASFLAEAIHSCSTRRDHCFVRARCGQYSGGLLEATLFGSSRRRAWTTSSGKRGTIANANCGSLFIEQIQHATPSVQARLFELIANSEYAHFGRTSVHRVDVRLIVSASLDLEAHVDKGMFMPKLSARLHQSSIELHDACTSQERILAVIDLLRGSVTLQTADATARVTDSWMNAARTATQTPASTALRRAMASVAQRFSPTAPVELIFHAALHSMCREMPQRRRAPMAEAIALAH